MGHKRVAWRSDSEPQLLALREAVRKERDVGVILEEAPAGDREASG